VRAAQKRYKDAIAYYQKALAIVPLPEYATALGDIYRKTGQRTAADKQYALVEYIGRLTAFNQIIYNRELAYFYADHDIKLPQALELTRNEIETRKDVYGYDALAWALYKNGRTEEAQAAIASALELGTKDARLLFHAGMIAYSVGEYSKAEAYLEQALTLNPSFHVLQADEARKTLRKLQAKSGARRDVAKRRTEWAQ
jgi:tetratricopeptide (TPR) repeat protein